MAVRQWGETALYKAAYNNLTDLAEVLLAANANVEIKNNVRGLQLAWCWLLIVFVARMGKPLSNSPRVYMS